MQVRKQQLELDMEQQTSSKEEKEYVKAEYCHLAYLKPDSILLFCVLPLTVWITINCGKFWKTWEYQTTWPASWEICMQVRKQQLEVDMEQQTGFK